MRELHLALAANRAYLPWCATTIASALTATTTATVTVHVVLDTDVTSNDKDLLRGMCERLGGTADLHTLDAGPLGRLPSGAAIFGGAISNARILLPDLLPSVEELIYLDSDVLVLGDLTALIDEVPSGTAVAAVRNICDDAMAGHARSLGLDSERYFNSGVMVMNLAAMRRESRTAQMVDVLHDRGERLVMVDQDAYNIVFADTWFELNPRWNVQQSYTSWRPLAVQALGAQAVDAALSNPGIVHFEGPQSNKPWHQLAGGAHVEHYRRLLATTPWAGTPRAASSTFTRILVRLPLKPRMKAYGALRRLGHP